MEWFPQLESCCFVCNLRRGTLTIGLLGLIGYITGCVFFTLFFINKILQKIELTSVEEISYLVLYGVGTIYTSVHIIINIVLLLGVCMKKPILIKSYVVVSILCVTMIFLMLLLLLISKWEIVVVTVVLVVMEIYFLYVVNSYYFAVRRKITN